jgi:hypothetical protein
VFSCARYEKKRARERFGNKKLLERKREIVCEGTSATFTDFDEKKYHRHSSTPTAATYSSILALIISDSRWIIQVVVTVTQQ